MGQALWGLLLQTLYHLILVILYDIWIWASMQDERNLLRCFAESSRMVSLPPSHPSCMAPGWEFRAALFPEHFHTSPKCWQSFTFLPSQLSLFPSCFSKLFSDKYLWSSPNKTKVHKCAKKKKSKHKAGFSEYLTRDLIHYSFLSHQPPLSKPFSSLNWQNQSYPLSRASRRGWGFQEIGSKALPPSVFQLYIWSVLAKQDP